MTTEGKIDPNARLLWVLMPAKREAYVPLFEGTLAEVMAEAVNYAGFWKTRTTVMHSPNGRWPEGRVTVAVVSVPKDAAKVA